MLRISRAVWQQIQQTVGTRPPECGGVLGAGSDGVVTEFIFDATGASSPTGYTPDVNAINRVLAQEWMPRNILMVGIVHSHAGGVTIPSCMDVNYGMHILQALDTVDRFYLPIVTLVDGFHMTGYVIERQADVRCVCRKCEYEVVGSGES